jgi:cobalamin biosynthetic protein CobC
MTKRLNKTMVEGRADKERHPPIQIYTQHNHGGQLHAASQQYNIPLENWLDLSTGISPYPYPLPPVPVKCWQRLPEPNDGLEFAAENYYGSPFLLPVSGSQEAIQRLPYLFEKERQVGIIKPAYHSHQQAWQRAGHHVTELSSSEIEQKISELDVLILVNPTNPSTESFTPETVMNWHQKLIKHNGCLIIDEAFMDAMPEQSVICKTPKPGLIVLRSIGKFFGLAGVRLGFVWAETNILEKLASKQDDWSVSHPARWAGTVALGDTTWQQQQRNKLQRSSERLKLLLENRFQTCVLNTALFTYFQHDQAQSYHQKLAEDGVLVRLFEDPLALRFGLPASVEQWQCLESALELLD